MILRKKNLFLKSQLFGPKAVVIIVQLNIYLLFGHPRKKGYFFSAPSVIVHWETTIKQPDRHINDWISCKLILSSVKRRVMINDRLERENYQ